MNMTSSVKALPASRCKCIHCEFLYRHYVKTVIAGGKLIFSALEIASNSDTKALFLDQELSEIWDIILLIFSLP